MSEPVAEPKKAEESTDWDELSFLDDCSGQQNRTQ